MFTKFLILPCFIHWAPLLKQKYIRLLEINLYGKYYGVIVVSKIFV